MLTIILAGTLAAGSLPVSVFASGEDIAVSADAEEITEEIAQDEYDDPETEVDTVSRRWKRSETAGNTVQYLLTGNPMPQI